MSYVNGHFAILDKVVFLVSDYELLIFSGLFLVPLIITMFCTKSKNMLTILGFTTFDLNEFALVYLQRKYPEFL